MTNLPVIYQIEQLTPLSDGSIFYTYRTRDNSVLCCIAKSVEEARWLGSQMIVGAFGKKKIPPFSGGEIKII